MIPSQRGAYKQKQIQSLIIRMLGTVCYRTMQEIYVGGELVLCFLKVFAIKPHVTHIYNSFSASRLRPTRPNTRRVILWLEGVSSVTNRRHSHRVFVPKAGRENSTWLRLPPFRREANRRPTGRNR